MAQSWVLLCIEFLLLVPLIPPCFSQSNPQNIETFYPGTKPDPSPSPAPTPESRISQPPETAPLRPPPSRSEVVKAVAATAATTLVFAAVFFFCLQRHCLSRRKQGAKPNPFAKRPAVAQTQFGRVDGNVKGVIVDDDGLDVLYWRKLEERNSGSKKNGYEVLQKNHNRHEQEQGTESYQDLRKKTQPTQEIPLLREKSSASYDFNRVGPEIQDKHQIQVAPPPPPPPIPKKGPPAPPMPPRANGSKPPPPPPKGMGSSTRNESSSAEEGNGQMKLKPLHWDKLNPNTDHSMVWNKLDRGSFKFDGDLMESLFGYVGTGSGPSNGSTKPGNAGPGKSSQIVLLDPRKSQNIAIVLKSLGISHNELLNGLREGQGLEVDTIEKLTRVAPTKEEESMILGFDGDPERLADAECFLYHLLHSVPSAFTRLNAMHFRSHYGSEIAHLKESLQTLELGCNELRTGGLFMKLLEAILKAGNRMNAGTARGNAQAFNLTALRKLSDVKSTDRKTTLLHFVVEEVVRAEGKKCIINRNRSLNRNNSLSSDMSKEEREKQYTMLGLPVVGGLSSEFTNVKKSASIDYDTFAGTYSGLSSRVAETQKLVLQCEAGEVGGFVSEMRGFLDKAEEELSLMKEEQWRVTELVKRTTEYYQAGAFKDKGAAPLHLFVIVKDFLSMVDQVCIEIARNLQRRKAARPSSGSPSPDSPALRSKAKFPTLPKHFMSEKSEESSSSDSDNE